MEAGLARARLPSPECAGVPVEVAYAQEREFVARAMREASPTSSRPVSGSQLEFHPSVFQQAGALVRRLR